MVPTSITSADDRIRLLDSSLDETARLLGDLEGMNYGSQTNPTEQHEDEEFPGSDEEEAAIENSAPEEPTTNESERDTMVERLTRRLRCLFSAITWPIVPLGTLVSLCLLWVLYSAFVVDIKNSCSHPLHAYALASLCFLCYAPYHAQIRSYLFRYSRERDGPIRPTGVRLYDQLFHTICILYVYGGVTLLQSCKQDVGDNHTDEVLYKDESHNATYANTCDATCPHLFVALDVYVTMLELFTLSLILPLLFLPCIYLWIIQRASNEAENFWQDSLEDSDDLFGRGPRISAAELIDSLEIVKLIRRGETLAIQSASSGFESSQNVTKDCCICMSDFAIECPEVEPKVAGPVNDDDSAAATATAAATDAIVRTKCGHVFHTACLGGWIGGRWDPTDHSSNQRRRARRTCCPLCREDLQPSRTTNNRTAATADDVV